MHAREDELIDVALDNVAGCERIFGGFFCLIGGQENWIVAALANPKRREDAGNVSGFASLRRRGDDQTAQLATRTGHEVIVDIPVECVHKVAWVDELRE